MGFEKIDASLPKFQSQNSTEQVGICTNLNCLKMDVIKKKNS